jgi:regulatory protein YycH of two-component signal transduction system YycFG
MKVVLIAALVVLLLVIAWVIWASAISLEWGQ